MGSAYFYHLTREPLDLALPKLIGSARKAGWRVVVRGRSEGQITWLDDRLWQEPAHGFLPHGVAGGADDARQPVLLTTGTEAPNGAQCLMSVEGAAVTPEEVMAMERVCILFDGNDPAAVEGARNQWRSLTGAGAAAQYWSQESGKWEKKAEAGGGA
jgi:DNA polymerase-3 subunit chi